MTTNWIPDHSAVAAFRENPEAFRLKYRLNLQPAHPNDKMRAGSAIHAGRNVLYEARKAGIKTYDDATIAAAVAAARAHRTETPGFRDAAHVERIVRAYATVHGAEPFEVVANEEYVEARVGCENCAAGDVPSGGAFGIHDAPKGASQLCTAFTYCGICDAVLRFPDGSEYVMDTKTTGAYLGEEWHATMGLSDQMTGYVALRRALGHRCDGYIVDGVHISDYIPKKPPHEPKVDLEKDFVRAGPIRVPEWRVERWARDMRFTLTQIAQLERERGLAEPWPIYQNWAYGKVDAYREFYEQPAELHESVALTFEKRAWSPREVAEERAVK